MTTSFKICGFSFRHYLDYLIIYNPIKVKKLRFSCQILTPALHVRLVRQYFIENGCALTYKAVLSILNLLYRNFLS